MSQRIPYDPAAPDQQELEAFRNQSIEDRFLEGPRLFDLACRVAMDGIRHQHPDASDEQRAGILRDRIELMRRMEGDVDE